MSITASELRANVYKILDQVIETGTPVEIVRKGYVVCLVPAKPVSKLEKLVRREDFIQGDAEELIHLDWSGEWTP